jgi:hypothetical protein
MAIIFRTLSETYAFTEGTPERLRKPASNPEKKGGLYLPSPDIANSLKVPLLIRRALP